MCSLLGANYVAQVQADGMDVYEKRPLPGSGTGGINLGPASAAQAAVQRAAALEGPRMLRCDLCQVKAAK